MPKSMYRSTKSKGTKKAKPKGRAGARVKPAAGKKSKGGMKGY